MKDTKIKLLCFPYAGGSSYCYRELFDLAEFEVLPLEYSGHGQRICEAVLDNVESIANDLIDFYASAFEGRFAFFGHSMGALVAFHTARNLHALGKTMPEHLFVSGRPAPDTQRPDHDRYSLPHSDFFELINGLGGLPREALESEPYREFIEPIMRADLKACDTYCYSLRPVLDIPISVMIGGEEGISDAEALAWEHETNNTFMLQRYPGGHFFLFDHGSAIRTHIANELRA